MPALRDVVRRDVEHGDRRHVLNDLEQLRPVLREEGQDEGLVLDCMDFLTGWCSPQEVI
jgi:hypothetical protein